MKRRDFVKIVSGAVAVFPLPLPAQQPERARRIGSLSYLGADDPEAWS
jgi:hypothetical protein